MYRKDAFRSNMTDWILLLSEAQAKFVHRNKAIHSLSPGVPYSPKAAQNLARLHFTLHTLDCSVITYACKVQRIPYMKTCIYYFLCVVVPCVSSDWLRSYKWISPAKIPSESKCLGTKAVGRSTILGDFFLSCILLFYCRSLKGVNVLWIQLYKQIRCLKGH